MAAIIYPFETKQSLLPNKGTLKTGSSLQRIFVNSVPASRPIDILQRNPDPTLIRRTRSSPTGEVTLNGLDLSEEYDVIVRETGGIYKDGLIPKVTPVPTV